MQHHLTFGWGGHGWQVSGLPRDPFCLYADLADALDAAKAACDAEPAVIEIFVDSQYIVTVVQRHGWPLRLCRPTGLFRRGGAVQSWSSALARARRRDASSTAADTDTPG